MKDESIYSASIKWTQVYDMWISEEVLIEAMIKLSDLAEAKNELNRIMGIK